MSEESINEGVRQVFPDEWITRTVFVTEPFPAKIEVKINLTMAVKRSAFYALANAGGGSHSDVSTNTQSLLTREGKTVRDVWLRLNGKTRKCFVQNPTYAQFNEKVAPEFEVHPEEQR